MKCAACGGVLGYLHAGINRSGREIIRAIKEVPCKAHFPPFSPLCIKLCIVEATVLWMLEIENISLNFGGFDVYNHHAMRRLGGALDQA